MRYFLPDSQDLVDPTFDFATESRSRTRLRQRDDQYVHEVFASRAHDGILVSKSIVDGFGGAGARYTMGQRQRLLRGGVRSFFRLQGRVGSVLEVMGDCGAFSYVNEPEPPFTVDDVITFYEDCGFDFGISVDHIILGYDSQLDKRAGAPSDYCRRQQLTLDLAADFLRKARKGKARFTPLGVAQGWSPRSYAQAVLALQKIGYDYIALGGMVPLKTSDILELLRAVSRAKRPTTRLHLLGVTRTESIPTFASLGAVSFDSTSPLRQAFKDDKDNYYTPTRTYVAIRVPQIDANPALGRAIRAGRVPQDRARKLEREALVAMTEYQRRSRRLDSTLNALLEYERLFDPTADHARAYHETLSDRPWDACRCDICKSLGHHVILFRGAERNRRRGFHNVWTFYRRLQAQLGGRPPRALPAALPLSP